MSPRASTDRLLCDVEINTESYTRSSHPDNFDISPERRGQIEKGFLRKLDLRVSFLVLVWLMNIVSPPECVDIVATSLSLFFRLTEVP